MTAFEGAVGIDRMLAGGAEIASAVLGGEVVFAHAYLPTISRILVQPPSFRSGGGGVVNFTVTAPGASSVTAEAVFADGTTQAVAMTLAAGDWTGALAATPTQSFRFSVTATNGSGSVHGWSDFTLWTPVAATLTEGSGAHQIGSLFEFFLQGGWTGGPVRRATLQIGRDAPVELLDTAQARARHPASGWRRQVTRGRTGTAYTLRCVLVVYGFGSDSSTANVDIRVPA